MTTSNVAHHQVWTSQVIDILDDEFGADRHIALPSDQSLNTGFEPVAHWFWGALAPLIGTNATLRGETVISRVQVDQISGPDTDLKVFEDLVTAQLRYNFGFDAYFDSMHQSALAFSVENRAMINEHFGSPENYAEYYAETSCEIMQKIAARGLDPVLAARMKDAFHNEDVAAWTACFPGSFVRGVLTSYALAQGPTTPAALADTLKQELCVAFIEYD